MKRLLTIIICILCPLSLGGCSGIYANTREVEDLLVIQTMGLDDDPAGVHLTLASGAGAGADSTPLRLEGRGPSITAAIERVRSLANEEDLFCAHIAHVLIGEAAARRGIERELAYICRAPDLRLSVPVYVLRGAEAADAVLGVGNDRYGVCDALDSVDGDVKLRGDGHLTTAVDIARDLARQGSALICAVEVAPSAEQGTPSEGGAHEALRRDEARENPPESGGELKTVAAAGFGVLKDGRLCAFLSREQAVAVGLLRGESGPCELLVTGQDGKETTLSLEHGSAEFRPVWAEDGALIRLDIDIRAEAAVAETDGGDGLAAGPETEELRALLESALSERIAAVLQLSKQRQADFLGLGGRIESSDPVRFRALGRPFSELLGTLPVRLSVSARLTHSNDLEVTSA